MDSFVTFGTRALDYPAYDENGLRVVGILVGVLLVSLQGKDDSSKMTWRLECRDQ
jgi:hypothetical protein